MGPIMETILILVIVVLAATIVALLVTNLRRRDTPQGTLLKSWTADQLSQLTDAQLEAVRLWAWAERVGWKTVALNVELGKDFPIARKEIEQ